MAEGSETILTWNVPNWITVVLMAAVFFGLMAAAQSWYSKKQAAA